MYLLRRKISPYSGYDLILSITRSIQTAESLKGQYIEQRRKNDPWKMQAYHEVNLEKDTIIEDISIFFDGEPIGTKFFLVCRLEDYLGLCSLKIQKIFDRKDISEEYINDFYGYCDLLQNTAYLEVFEPEKTTEAYLKSLYSRLNTDEDDLYFKEWGGQLIIYEVQENELCKEDLPNYHMRAYCERWILNTPNETPRN